MAQPIPVTISNSSGYSLPFTTPTLNGYSAQPTPICFTDRNGNEYQVTGGSVAGYTAAPTPMVLCNPTGDPLQPPVVFTSNGNSITINPTTTGNQLGTPAGIALTDGNGNVLTEVGFVVGSIDDAVTSGVLSDINGNTISLTIAT